ncbi:MAG TPA: hypothetical protein ENK51_10315 [Gammaproteobacteria bacterium]|nr:hypothetical protein [Gammaproteobacteria bacterium]
MTRSIHRLVLPRLVLVWLLLSMVFGGAVYWLGMRHIDDKVVDLILRESRIFTPQDMAFLLNPGPGINEVLMGKAELLVNRHCSLIEIYDPRKTTLLPPIVRVACAWSRSWSAVITAFPSMPRCITSALSSMVRITCRFCYPCAPGRVSLPVIWKGSITSMRRP